MSLPLLLRSPLLIATSAGWADEEAVIGEPRGEGSGNGQRDLRVLQEKPSSFVLYSPPQLVETIASIWRTNLEGRYA